MSSNEGRARGWVAPILALASALGLALAFPDLALVCIVAVLIVYLIEPVVHALSSVSIRGRRLPRWGAVLSVYTCMLGATIGFSAVFGPVVAGEAAALADEVPEFIQQARTRYAPQLNAAVRSFRTMFADEVVVQAPISVARGRVDDALDSAQLHALLASVLDGDELDAYRAGQLVVDADSATDAAGPVLLRVRADEGGTLEVLAGDGLLHVVPAAEGGWLVSSGDGADEEAGGVDIARALSDSFNTAIESSGEQMAEVLHIGQRLIGGVLSALVAVFVTFMVAGFISVDVPRIVGAVTSLFPRENRPAVIRLLGRLDHGLSGVIRGQLAICLINALLTGMGLFIFKVKFALLLALIAGVFSLIPMFGTILSTIPAVVLALPQGLGTALLVIVWIIVIHFIEANILQPKIMGTTARIHPAAVILALVAGEHAYGVVGALVAVPTVSVAQSLLLFVRDEYSRPGGYADGEGAGETATADDVDANESHLDDMPPEE